MSLHTIKIKTPKDLELLNPSGYYNLEVYLHNAVIPIHSLKGSLKVRAMHCNFPNLSQVRSDVSIDAKGVRLPELEKVYGHLNVHEAQVELPKLKVVLGTLEILQPLVLSNLEIVTGKMILKSGDISMPKMDANRRTKDKWIEIRNQSNADELQEEEFRNILINYKYPTSLKPSLRIPTKVCYGAVKVISSNCFFPNLNKIGGDFIIEANDGKRVATPLLNTISGHCILSASNQTINVITVEKMLFIKKGINNTFPSLQSVGKLNLSREGSELIAPQLYDIKKQSVFLGKLKAPQLEVINIDYNYRFNHDLPNLKVIHGDVRYFNNYYNEPAANMVFGNLEIINGDLTTHDAIRIPKLKHVRGKIRVENKASVFPKLKTVGEIIGQNELRERFIREGIPNIEHINKLEYQAIKKPEIVKEFYHTINEGQRLSKNGFYLNSRWGGVFEHLSLIDYIRILKMRHSSYQNFYSREVEREWIGPMNAHLKSILNTIRKLWKNTPAYKFKDLFKIDQPNLRRFSFNYVGVAEMMKALGAKRISTDGIEVNYYQYDAHGGKAMVKKHNIFETYEANFNQINDLRNWRNRAQKAYAVKCWCTSTNQEHWLWIEEKYKDYPLAAIASTFRIHENVIPHIKCLKRQGDVLICEMKKQVIPKGAVVPLTPKQYFGLLVAES